MYFIPDERKEGGRYEEKEGNLRTIDTYHKMLVFTDGVKVSVDFTYYIRTSQETS